MAPAEFVNSLAYITPDSRAHKQIVAYVEEVGIERYMRSSEFGHIPAWLANELVNREMSA